MLRGRGICVIAAASTDGIIGVAGQLPWRIPRDWAQFARTTAGGILLSGRSSFEETGLLPGRTHVVLSRSAATRAQLRERYGVRTASTLAEGLREAALLEDDLPHAARTFICGGEALYAEALPSAHHLLLTTVHHVIEENGAELKDVRRFPSEWPNYFPPASLVSSDDFVDDACELKSLRSGRNMDGGGAGVSAVDAPLCRLRITLAAYSVNS